MSKQSMIDKLIPAILLLGIVFLGMGLRLYNLNWDENNHLHPDERFLTMVTNEIKLPDDFSTFLNTSISPFNPHNIGFDFYVYGTFPIFVTKLLSLFALMDNYDRITLLGRFISAILDSCVLALVIILVYKFTRKFIPVLLAAIIYAFIPLSIQLSHFYITDTWLVFFSFLSFASVYMLSTLRSDSFGLRSLLIVISGFSIGLMLASKVSGLYVLPFIFFSYMVAVVIPKPDWSKFKRVIAEGLTIILVTIVVFRFAQPYAFQGPGAMDLGLNPKLLDNWEQLQSWSDPELAPPFAYQWMPTKPIIFTGQHAFMWGLGLPIGTLLVSSLLLFCWLLIKRISKSRSLPYFFSNPFFIASVFWILFLFFYQSVQFAKPLRYLYPAMPFVSLIIGILLGEFVFGKIRRRYSYISLVFLAVVLFWWGIATNSMYRLPHTRLQASMWIYENVSAGSSISYELWDDALPLPIGDRSSAKYNIVQLSMYDADTNLKWEKLATQLADVDYVILSSNRVWRSISALPKKYPISSSYYERLFNEELGYKKIATFTSYPCLFPRSIYGEFDYYNQEPIDTDTHPDLFRLQATKECFIALNTDGAEESVTVYDRPKVLIFKNEERYGANLLLKKLGVQ